MRTARIFAVLLLLASAAVAAPPPIPDTPAPVIDLVYARPFSLTEGFEFRWSAERPVVTRGVILVLDVDPALIYPRQVAEPVLYVGDRTAQRVSRGYPAGRVLAIVPGDVDLAGTPIFFGTPELPERIDAATARGEREQAVAAGIRPLPPGVVDAALLRGGVTFTAPDVRQLDRELAGVYERFILPLSGN